MRSEWPKLIVGLLVAGALPFFSTSSSAQSRLDDFEEDAGGGDDHSSDDDHRHDGWSLFDDDDDDSLFIDLFEFLLVDGGVHSWQRVRASELRFPDIIPRASGEVLLPFLRVDAAYQDVESDITAVDLRGEVGYGPFGAQVAYTRYDEDSPPDELEIVRYLGLYRMSIGPFIETDLGFGALSLRGNDRTTKFLFSMPVLVHPSERWGVEWRPAWSDRITDHDLALLLSAGPASLKLGYRWMHSPHVSLDGPYIGLSMHL